MNKLLSSICLLAVLFCFSASILPAQNSTKDNIHLFQSFFRDAPITDVGYGEAFADYRNSDFLNTTTFGARVGYAVIPEVEVGAGLFYRNLDFDEPGIESGLADVPVYGRYNFVNEETKFSAGAFATIPIGDEIIGGGNFNFGFFGAVRHPVSEFIVLTETLGVDFLDTAIEDYEASLNMGAGLIYSASERLHILGELAVQADTDYSALTGGIDYQLAEVLRFVRICCSDSMSAPLTSA